MKIAIVDDQKEFIEIIQNKLAHINADIYSYTSLFDMEKTKLNFDLLLLDIDMPDYDGIQYAKTHKNQNIIFITNQHHRIKDAFGNNVYGFIDKDDDNQRYQNIIHSTLTELANQKSITLKTNYEILHFYQKDIIYLIYEGCKTISLLYQNQTYTIKGYTLANLSNKLDHHFIYISRDVIVNAHMITDFIGDKLYLKGIRQCFIVSRRRKKDVLHLLESEW